MDLINVIFLIVLTNALTGAVCMKVWSAVSGILEKRADYVTAYRLLRLGIIFYILPGLALLFAPGVRALAAGAGLSASALSGRIAVIGIFAAALVWMAGAAVSVIRYLREIRSFCRICEHNVEIGDERLREYFAEICMRRNIFKRVLVCMNTEINAPVIFGVIRRQILLPVSCAGESELRMILEHEIIHVKHNDLFAERIAAIIGCIIWFLPQPKRMLAALEDWSETVCDISVCASNASVWKPKEYFSLVVRSAREEEAPKPGMVMALGGGESSAIGIRIHRMRQYDASGSPESEAASQACRRAAVYSPGGQEEYIQLRGSEAISQLTGREFVSQYSGWETVSRRRGRETISQPIGRKPISQRRGHEADFQPSVRSILLALGIALCVMFGIRQAGTAAASHIVTNDLVSHKILWYGAAGTGSRVLARGVFTVRAHGSGYRLLYLKENERIQVVYEASETHLSVMGDTEEDGIASDVFGTVYVSRLFGAAQKNSPAALTGGTIGFTADRTGWYVLKWDSDQTDAGVMIDYVITEQ